LTIKTSNCGQPTKHRDQITDSQAASDCRAVQVTIQPWFKDHCFNGRIILPAVEIMELLAGTIQEINPDIIPLVMSAARFAHFLEIPPEASALTAQIAYEIPNKSEITIRLLSRIQFKKITRSREHAELTFARALTVPTTSAINFLPQPASAAAIEAAQIYQELVPFGPAYRTLTGPLHLSRQGAWGCLQAKKLCPGQEPQKKLGSPLPLDGAMHAACVLGQCLADFVPFPVGFNQRIIHQPTQAGQQYRTTVRLRAHTQGELVFDLVIADMSGTVYETVTGLQMRDISGGISKPPAWIKKLLQNES